MPWMILLLACGDTAPTVDSVSPAEALPGASVQVFGEAFPGTAQLELVQGDEVVALQGEVVRGPVLIEAPLPSDISPGTWTVRVLANGELRAELPGGLVVAAPVEEAPCGGAYQANAQLGVAQEQVVIDRFHEGGRRETLRFTFGDIEQVEYELIQLDGDTLCSVIYLRKKDGTRVSFDDDTRTNLEKRALRLGNAMGRKVVTTRRDVDEDPRPLEGG